MKRANKAKHGKKATDAPPEDDRVRFIERPDGVYWRAGSDGAESGPFRSLAEAAASAEAREDTSYEPGESVAEAEAEIGITEWIDPDTGVPAEESVPRIEDH